MSGCSVEPVLAVDGLRTWFDTAGGQVRAVDGVSLAVAPGEVVGLVGESGSGKTVTLLSALRLVPRPGRIVAGSVRVAGRDVLAMDEGELRTVRGDIVSMIFQQPVAALNPAHRSGRQIAEVYELHAGGRPRRRDDDQRWERAVELLRRVGIPDPGRRARSYPHQLSGGQAQRVMIAMALAAEPELLVADEPTTALDVTIQAQILDLIADVQAERGMAVVLITHDLGIVAQLTSRVVVLYGGQVVEVASTVDLYRRPLHPYAVGLLGSVPALGARVERLTVIPGRVPTLVDPPEGCRFAARCEARVAHGLTRCTEATPALVEVEPGRSVRCFLHSDAAEEPFAVPVEVGRR